MNWLEHARREIGGIVGRRAANTAEGNQTAAMTVRHLGESEESAESIDSNGSALNVKKHEMDEVQETFEERAAIMEYEGGLSRKDAETAAWTSVSVR